MTILFDRISYTCLATADESMVPETEIKEGLKIQKILRKEYKSFTFIQTWKLKLFSISRLLRFKFNKNQREVVFQQL